MGVRERTERHAKLRLLQRYGVRISPARLRVIVERIRNGEGILLKRISRSRQLFAVEMGRDATLVPVIYSNVRKTIVTVLPENVLAEYRAKIESIKKQLPKHRQVKTNGETLVGSVAVEESSNHVEEEVERFELKENEARNRTGREPGLMEEKSSASDGKALDFRCYDHERVRLGYRRLRSTARNSRIDQRPWAPAVPSALPVKFVQDRQIARMKYVDPNIPTRRATYFFYDETPRGRVIRYVQSCRECATTRAEILALLARHNEGRLENYPVIMQKQMQADYLKRLEAGLVKAGLHWQVEEFALAA